jgi:hypothetical protein
MECGCGLREEESDFGPTTLPNARERSPAERDGEGDKHDADRNH